MGWWSDLEFPAQLIIVVAATALIGMIINAMRGDR